MRPDRDRRLALSGATTAVVALVVVSRHPEMSDSPAWAVAVSLAAALGGRTWA